MSCERPSAATSKGKVVLVGAGPGSPDLLTLRAIRALEEADVVLYDALVDPCVLNYAKRAHRFYVGKRAGRPSISQEAIHKLLLRAARSGRVAVRLKAGDPFVFGRGGEEAIAMNDAGVEVEIIPGISSAIAGPSSAGIPVTHRSVAHGFLTLSAVPEEPCTRVLKAMPPGVVTVVLLMAMGARSRIAETLMRAGWPADLPTAIVLGAHGPRQWSWTGALEDVGQVEPPSDRADLPGLVVIGDVVELANLIKQTPAAEEHRAEA